jgi:hypothetical protein
MIDESDLLFLLVQSWGACYSLLCVSLFHFLGFWTAGCFTASWVRSGPPALSISDASSCVKHLFWCASRAYSMSAVNSCGACAISCAVLRQRSTSPWPASSRIISLPS